MRASDGPMAMETTYTWTDEGDGTRMRLRNCGGPSGFAKLTAPIMAAAVRRATTKDLARLKEILEGQAWPTSGPPRVGPARLMSEARSQLDDPTTRRPAPVLASSASSVALIRGWTTLSKRRGMTLTGPRMLVHRIWPNGAQTNPL
jgi:hypothetical protein